MSRNPSVDGPADGRAADDGAAEPAPGGDRARAALHSFVEARGDLAALLDAGVVPTANGDAEAALIQLDYACRRVGDVAERVAELAARLAGRDVGPALGAVPARVGNALVIGALRVHDVLDVLAAGPGAYGLDGEGVVVTLSLRIEEVHDSLDDARSSLDEAERALTEGDGAEATARHLRWTSDSRRAGGVLRAFGRGRHRPRGR
ncbi:MAG TPA: hypothetical protein VK306_13470 [Acidimicrobiales bacterium]|nr:hypothetical protein [Acidimicrobiales bacterium]